MKKYTGFLQLKDPLPSTSSTSKTFVPEITTLLSQSFTTTTKGKKQENDPTIKFIKELQSDLEVVYVGQMCLSWEILHWQYEKALHIWESDPRGIRRFNDIADEFQQFQVLMQRFVEEESFQGPRVQNYVKNRCVFRNLLQVPVIRGEIKGVFGLWVLVELEFGIAFHGVFGLLVLVELDFKIPFRGVFGLWVLVEFDGIEIQYSISWSVWLPIGGNSILSDFFNFHV